MADIRFDGKVAGAALGVTALAAGAAVWTAQADAVDGAPPRAAASATPGSDVKPVAVTIVHASDKGARGVNITIDDGPDPKWTPQMLDVLRKRRHTPTSSSRSSRPGTDCATTPCRTTPPWTRSPRPTSRSRYSTPNA